MTVTPVSSVQVLFFLIVHIAYMLQRDIFGNVAAFCYEFDLKVAVVWLAFIIINYLSPLKSFAHNFYYIYLFCECAVLSRHECGGQRTTHRSEFSLSSRWAQGWNSSHQAIRQPHLQSS